MSLARIFLSAILIAALAGLAGCSDEETTAPSGDSENAFIAGSIMQLNTLRSCAQSTESAAIMQYDAAVSIANVSSVPEVRINGIPLLPASPRPIGFEANSTRAALPYIPSSGLYYYGRLSFEGANASLSVSYTKGDGSQGNASASITVPGAFLIDSTSNDGNITYVTDVTTTWRPSADAERYYIAGTCNAGYIDTAGQIVHSTYSFETLVMDTFFVFRHGDLFPASGDFENLISFSASLNLIAVNGPFMPGEGENISGDGRGFFIGLSIGGYIYLYYSSPLQEAPAAPAADTPDSEKMILERLLKLAARMPRKISPRCRR